MTKITLRGNGKCHRAIKREGFVSCVCSCPGSQNGKLANQCVEIEDTDWSLANCGT